MEHLDSLAGSISYKVDFAVVIETNSKHKYYSICWVRVFRLWEKSMSVAFISSQHPWIGKSPSTLRYHQLMFSLDMLSPLDPSRDLRLSGQVIYTGRSSMEVAVKMETLGPASEISTVLLGELQALLRFN